MTSAGEMLILGVGNPARHDDGLGPAFAQALEDAALPHVDVIWDYQPRVENAADIAEYETVLFADACTSGRTPYALRRLLPRAAESFSSHVLPPESVLALARDLLGWTGQAYLLGIRGYSFEPFEEQLTTGARANLLAAVEHLKTGVARRRLDGLLTDPPTDNTLRGGEPCETATT